MNKLDKAIVGVTILGMISSFIGAVTTMYTVGFLEAGEQVINFLVFSLAMELTILRAEVRSRRCY